MTTWRWDRNQTALSQTAREDDLLLSDDEALEALTIFCPRRDHSVAMEVCIDCPDFGGLRWDADGEIAGGRCNVPRKPVRTAPEQVS